MSLSRLAEVKSDPSAACVEFLESLLAEANLLLGPQDGTRVPSSKVT
jgi:hypothetical protein